MAILKAKDILEISDIQKEIVAVPEWGGEVWVYGLSGAERDKLESGMIEVDEKGKRQSYNMANFRAKMAIMAVRDEKGKRLFTDADLQRLSQKSAVALQRIFIVAQRLAGITEDDLNDIKKVIEESPFEDSSSDSPLQSEA